LACEKGDCRTGRYTECFSRIVTETGRVYAVDIHDFSIRAVNKRIAKHHIRNVETYLAEGYHSGIPDHAAERVCAIDKETSKLVLQELESKRMIRIHYFHGVEILKEKNMKI
jgi:hypothetical protein